MICHTWPTSASWPKSVSTSLVYNKQPTLWVERRESKTMAKLTSLCVSCIGIGEVDTTRVGCFLFATFYVCSCPPVLLCLWLFYVITRRSKGLWTTWERSTFCGPGGHNRLGPYVYYPPFSKYWESFLFLIEATVWWHFPCAAHRSKATRFRRTAISRRERSWCLFCAVISSDVYCALSASARCR